MRGLPTFADAQGEVHRSTLIRIDLDVHHNPAHNSTRGTYCAVMLKDRSFCRPYDLRARRRKVTVLPYLATRPDGR
jgi:hypothetical protein